MSEPIDGRELLAIRARTARAAVDATVTHREGIEETR